MASEAALLAPAGETQVAVSAPRLTVRVCCGGPQRRRASSFPQGLLRETLPPPARPTRGGDYIFYLSLLGSVFPADSRPKCNQPRKPPCVRAWTGVIPLSQIDIRFPVDAPPRYLGTHRPPPVSAGGGGALTNTQRNLQLLWEEYKSSDWITI